MKTFAIFVVVSLFATSAHSIEVRDYFISCDQDSFQYILDNPFLDYYIPCSLEYNGQFWDDAELRLRGESSREYPKKSFKVNFDGNNRFFGRDKVNLISCWTDPSFAREYLSYTAFHMAGLPASRTWYARFFVNGAYRGLYLDVEQVDEHFLEQNELPDDATIYKADGNGAHLLPTDNVAAIWQRETNESEGFDNLLDLIDYLDRATISEFDRLLPYKFDLEPLCRVIALNASLGNQSTYYHNYFLIHDELGDGKWQMLPWDMDLTFYFWDGFKEPMYCRSGHQFDTYVNALVSKCWQNPVIRDIIFEQMEDLAATVMLPESFTELVTDLQSSLYEAVDADTFKQYTTESFVAEINGLPLSLAGRRDAMLNLIPTSLQPFNVRAGLKTNQGFHVFWTPAVSPIGEPVSYEVWFAENGLFNDDISYDAGSSNHLLIETPPSGKPYFKVYAITPTSRLQSISYMSYYDSVAVPLNGKVVTEMAGDLVWSNAEGPYYVLEDLDVSQEQAFRIEAGTHVLMAPEKSLRFSGHVSIEGTENDSVVFEPLEEKHSWGRIEFDSVEGTILIRYAVFRGGGVQTNLDIEPALIVALNTELEISDSRFADGHLNSGGIAAHYVDLTLDRVNMDLPLVSLVGALNWPDALLIFGGSTRLFDCQIKKTEGAIHGGDLVDIANSSDSVVISGCTLENPGDDAVDFDYVSNAFVSRCRIRGTGDSGFSLGHSAELRIENCIVTESHFAVTAKEGTEAELYNNVFASNEVGILHVPQDNEDVVIVRNTVFLQNGEQIIDESGLDNLLVSYCGFDVGGIGGAGNITGDLRLTDPASGNFLPLPSSPLVDAGYGPGSPATDIRDSARVDLPDVANTGIGEPDYVDIGAYELMTTDTISPPVPASFMFAQNFPNPFNSWTTIRFGVVVSGDVELKIYNIRGQLVFRNRWLQMPAGTYNALWDAYGSQGFPLASGVYIVRLTQAVGTVHSKMILLR